MSVDKPKLPKVSEHALSGQLGEITVKKAVVEMGHMYDSRGALDHGIDGTIELVNYDNCERHATGRQIAVQVKRGESVVVKTRFGRTLYCTEAHVNYWTGHSLPVIVVHCEPDTDRLRWTHVNSKTLRKTPQGFAIDIPEDSDFRRCDASLRALALPNVQSTTQVSRTLFLPYSESAGITISDSELGLAVLEASRAIIRGTSMGIQIELEDEAILIATIDAIRDKLLPTDEERRDAIIREDILARQRTNAKRIHRAVTLLVSAPQFVEFFGYQESWWAAAVRRTAPPLRPPRIGNPIRLQAWPNTNDDNFVVGFDVPLEELKEFYARDPMNRSLIRMGASGGVRMSELSDVLIATCFLPALVSRLAMSADTAHIAEFNLLNTIQVQFTDWFVGVA